jgi:hypothetical protein
LEKIPLKSNELQRHISRIYDVQLPETQFSLEDIIFAIGQEELFFCRKVNEFLGNNYLPTIKDLALCMDNFEHFANIFQLFMKLRSEKSATFE